MIETIRCLYCDTENTVAQGESSSKKVLTAGKEPLVSKESSQKEYSEQTCSNCGMALPKCHPHSGTYRRRMFKRVFWAIVIFCLFMIVYLPR